MCIYGNDDNPLDFQIVLLADGSVIFHYEHVFLILQIDSRLSFPFRAVIIKEMALLVFVRFISRGITHGEVLLSPQIIMNGKIFDNTIINQ